MNANSNESEDALPEIIFFRTSDAVVEKREAFSLLWEVRNADTVEIFKNGMPFLKRNADEKTVVVHETYDGKDKDVRYTLTAINDFGQIHSLPVSVRVTDVVHRQSKYPEIIYFETTASVVQNKEFFTLSWEVKNATHVDLYRNGLVYKKYGADKTSINIQESYDGRDKDITYSLLASNNKEKIESDPLTVSVKEKTTPVPAWEAPSEKEDEIPAIVVTDEDSEAAKDEETEETGHTAIIPQNNQVPYADEETPLTQLRYQERRQKNLRSIRMYLWAILLLVIVGISGVVYYFQSKTKILDFEPRSEEEHTIVITGRNFPADSNKFQVLFNNIRGSVKYNAENVISVIVPFLGDQKTDDSSNVEVDVALVYKGDTIRASKKLLVARKIKDKVQQADSTSMVVEPAGTVLDTAPVSIDKSKKPVKVIDASKLPAAHQAQPVVDSPAVVKTEETKKPVLVDIYKLVHASPGDYNRRLLGGIKGLKITLVNESDYVLDNVTVTINYLKGNEREVKKEELGFSNVKPHSTAVLDGSRTNKGSKVTCSVTSINSKQLDADLKR